MTISIIFLVVKNMTKRKTQKKKNAELVVELNSKAKSASKSEIAVNMQSKKQQKKEEKKTTKVRNVEMFLKQNVKDDVVDNSALATVRQRRAYRVSQIAEDNNTLYDATMYRNKQTNKLELLTQSIANELVEKFVAELNSQEQFTAQDIMKLHETCGGAYGDKVRNALYKLSLRTTLSAIEKDKSAVITEAVQKKKTCIFYDRNNDESKRKSYIFEKL